MALDKLLNLSLLLLSKNNIAPSLAPKGVRRNRKVLLVKNETNNQTNQCIKTILKSGQNKLPDKLIKKIEIQAWYQMLTMHLTK